VPRVFAFLLTGGSLALALGIRLAAGSVLDSSNPINQVSGTVLYASAVYGGVLFLFPRSRPGVVAAVAAAFCWLVEFFQLTGVPAAWSAHSIAARLALGVHFDPFDLAWYLVGVLLAVALHHLTLRRHLTA
jgi:hypothetical protein